MIIHDVDTWYDLFGLNCQKGEKSTGTWDVFLMLWTLWGLGHDNLVERARISSQNENLSLFRDFIGLYI